MQTDAPEPVALAIVRAIECDPKEGSLGFPESLFARINGILPGLVDRSLAVQLPALMTDSGGTDATTQDGLDKARGGLRTART